MTKETILQELLRQNEGVHLGDLCGWSISGDTLQSEVREIATRLGIADDLGLPTVSAASAYRRAVIDAIKSGRGDERKFDSLKLDDTETKIVHAIVERSVKTGGSGELTSNDADFHTELKVGFDKDGYKNGKDVELLLRSEDDTHIISRKIRARYDELCVKYLPRDIRVAFQRAFEKWGAIRLLDHGGLWWVPAPYADKVRSWKEFMSELNNTTVIIPVFDTEETISSLREQSSLTLEAQLNSMIEDLEAFASASTTRVSTLEKRLDMFEELRNRVELHAKVLGLQQNELLEKLDAAANGLSQSLNSIES